MANPNQFRGALLEEAILWLLRFAGYRTVSEPGLDPTLYNGHAGLEVRGRGTNHQIDAIADFSLGQPFANPQRLLVEAKAYDGTHKVGVQHVRNAVGVLKDVSEFWVGNGIEGPSNRRYHYQYAIFSLTPFTNGAQRYAFAQDVYLVPLARSRYFAPVVDALRRTVNNLPLGRRRQVGVPLRDLRMALREALKLTPDRLGAEEKSGPLEPLLDALRSVGLGLLGTAGRAFPLFLVPRDTKVVSNLEAVVPVRIRRRDNAWYLQPMNSDEPLFSFDLPEELFDLYAERGVLSRERAVDLKAEYLSEIQVVYTNEGVNQLVTFRLDQEWLGEVRKQMAQG
jgi:hypothetical protein